MRLAILLAPLALAACDVQTSDAHQGKDGKDVHISLASGQEGGNKVSVNLPGFNANMNLPAMNIGAHMNINGVKLAPDSMVKRMDVLGKDKAAGDDHGSVRLEFTNPGPPASMMDYYRRSLADAGYTLGARGGDTALQATKDKTSFALALAPDGGGSRGTIMITGGGH